MSNKKAIIIGAGPAGLTAALELLEKTDIKPVIYEMSNEIGGISRTVNYKGNRIDIGGHRFFSKSDRVMKWWQNILPIQGSPAIDDILLNRNLDIENPEGPDPENDDKVMLIRRRLSRIFFLRKFFDYPISLSVQTLLNLGLFRTLKIGMSYIKIRLFPLKNEKSLEDFFINRFGKELYLTFFKDYTEKVWGVPCNEIKPEWGAQRIKGLSITKAILHALKNLKPKDTSISQKETETSLIEKFMYPKYGPGQMWETVAKMIQERGGELHFNYKATKLNLENGHVKEVIFENTVDGNQIVEKGDYIFSTMPVKDLVTALDGYVPSEVKKVAEGLQYRDFITCGLLLNKLLIKNQTTIKTLNNIVPDNWIYIQERDVKIGRLQIFNNWSPYLVSDSDKVWIGLEYFVTEGDEYWTKSDSDFTKFAIQELSKINIINPHDVQDSVVIRVPKAYPAYFGTYDDFGKVKSYLNTIENLFLIGRNGMHRYNNQDHSMLSAMTAVENIVKGITTKENIWEVNAEQEYHESK